MESARDQYIPSLIRQSLPSFFAVVINPGLPIVATVLTFYLATHDGVGPRVNRIATVVVVLLVFLFLVAIYNTRIMAIFMAPGDGPVRCQLAHYTLMICGSGGHTAEMIQMIERSIRPEQEAHRRWAVGKDDEKSYEKVLAFERRLLDRFSSRGLDSGTFDIVTFGRARYVHQSWLTTPFTAVSSLLDIARILARPPSQRRSPAFRYPSVIVTNGPGTGFLFLLVAKAFKLARLCPTDRMRTIYVESWARVKSLSLTGKLIRRFELADRFIAQSRSLARSPMIVAENLLVMPKEPPVGLDIPQKT